LRCEIAASLAQSLQGWIGEGTRTHKRAPDERLAGRSPPHDTVADGHYGTAPAGAFPANGYGLHNVT
jgi:hypothetical protein